MHQIRFRPRPRWGSLQLSPDSLAGFRGLLLRGGEGRERGGEWKERGKERRRGGKEKWEGKGSKGEGSGREGKPQIFVPGSTPMDCRN